MKKKKKKDNDIFDEKEKISLIGGENLSSIISEYNLKIIKTFEFGFNKEKQYDYDEDWFYHNSNNLAIVIGKLRMLNNLKLSIR